MVLTHYHADHIYGLQVFKEAGARIVAHAAAREYLFSDTAKLRLEVSRQELWPWIDEKTRLVPADVWLNSPNSFTVGGVQFDIQPVGPSHTAEDLVVYLPQKKYYLRATWFSKPYSLCGAGGQQALDRSITKFTDL